MFRESRTARAKVFKVTPGSHAAVYYRYTVDGSVFEGAGSSTGYRSGDLVRILYASGAPQDSDLQENIPTATGMIIFAFVGSLFLSLCGTTLISLGISSRPTPR
jgi:hypothetical protein